MKQIAFNRIKVGENYSREEIGDVRSLAESIREHGLQQPMVVDGDDRLVAGFRRHAALKSLGYDENLIWVNVTDSPNPPVVNLIENLERSNLTFYEECVAIKKLFPGCSEQEVADALNATRGWSRPRMKIWEFPDDIIELVKKGKLSPSKVTAISNCSDWQEAFDRLRSGGHVTQSKKPGKKEIQGAITECISRGLIDLAQAFRYTLGDIDEEEFWDSIDKG